MNNIPISISSTPPKAITAKQSESANATQADTAEFGQVLARQVTDSDKPASPPTKQSAKETSKKVADQNNIEATTQVEVASVLPAEMLATLVAQQSTPVASQEFTSQQTETPDQLNATLQPVAIAPFAANISGLATPNGPPLPAAGNKIASGNMQQPVLETALPAYSGKVSDGNLIADSAKSATVKELSPPNPGQSARPGGIGESPLTAQQAAIFPVLQGTAATVSSSPVVIQTPLTQPAWGEEFSQKITWMAGQRNQSAELHLNPPHLGPLDVVLKMNGDQASAIFTSPHAAVRDAIEQALPQLRTMLADSGIMLVNASVYDQTANKNQDHPPRKPTSAKPENGTEITTSASVISAAQSRHNGMVDTFA